MICNECNEGYIQHTSFEEFPDHIIHVFGCNKCDNGWGEKDPPKTKLLSKQELLTQAVNMIDEIKKDFNVFRFGPVHRENVFKKIEELEKNIKELQNVVK